MNNLKPCPKCGHIPNINDPDFIYQDSRVSDSWSVNCTNMLGLGTDDECTLTFHGYSREDVLNQWQAKRYYE